MTWLDERLGRVTMYRLLTLGLGLIGVVALGLAAAGQLFVTAGALLASAAVAVVASVASAWLCAVLFRTRAHTESAVITGLILLFLFWPTTDPRYLGTLALAALVGNLAKYVIAWRGRHLLNPAAAGALVIGLTGLDASTWWVADRLLLPVVLVVVVAIVIRTRRYLLVGTFVVVAVVAVAVRLTTEGQAFGPALWTALVSYPIVFLGGVMLTEPLTLPPRRHQQLVEAVVVGVVFAIPFTAGPLFSTPELALVVGNLYAFWCGQRGAVRLTVAGQRQITPRTLELALHADRPVRLVPGQYIEITVPHPKADARGTRRTFSVSSTGGPVASRAGDANGSSGTADATGAGTTTGATSGTTGPAARAAVTDLTVALTLPEQPSTFKRALAALPVGTRLGATGLGGDFLLPAEPAQPLLLVAGGIGVTPFASQLAAVVAAGEQRDVVVVYAVSDHADLAYAEVLTASGARVLVLSPTVDGALPDGWRHLGVRRLTPEVLAEAVPDADQRAAYVSGPPGMVGHTRRLLRHAGVRRVRTDAFSGY
ncbi:MAG TPA: FAD-dependent oxidoreductase [Cellulomonas sp.]